MDRLRTTLALLALLAVAAPSAALSADTWTDPFPGARLLRRTSVDPPWDIYVLGVDLTAPGVSMRATKSEERKSTTSAFARRVRAMAAINGDYFTSPDYTPLGLAVGSGELWPGVSDDSRFGSLIFGADNHVLLSPPEEVVVFNQTPGEMLGSIGGRPALVKDGTILDNTSIGPHCTNRHPRTAAGLSLDKKTLYLVVVDGRQAQSVGMTCNELAELMSSVGAYTALNLDGGGSTAMYVNGSGVINSPSGGRERVVANHLAIVAPLPANFGTIKGFAHEGYDHLRRLEGVTLTAAKDAWEVTDSQGRYAFDLPAGTYTVTASKPGYVTQTLSLTVTAEESGWLHVGLPVDPTAKADGPSADEGAASSMTEGSTQASSCSTGAGAATLLAPLLLVALWRTARRRPR